MMTSVPIVNAMRRVCSLHFRWVNKSTSKMRFSSTAQRCRIARSAGQSGADENH